MKIVDTIILLATIWFAICGFRKGFFYELFSFIAIVAGGWAAIFGQHLITPFLPIDSDTSAVVTKVIVFALVFVAVLILGKLSKTILSFVLPAWLDKLLGLCFGGFKVLLFAGLIFHFIAEIDVNEKIITRQRQESSITYTKCKTIADFLLPQFKHFNNVKATTLII